MDKAFKNLISISTKESGVKEKKMDKELKSLTKINIKVIIIILFKKLYLTF